jgi:hypothetical protein
MVSDALSRFRTPHQSAIFGVDSPSKEIGFEKWHTKLEVSHT